MACTADFIMHNPPWKSDTEDITLITKKIIEGLGKIGCKFIVIPFVDDSSIQKDDEDAAFKFLMSLESCCYEINVELCIDGQFCTGHVLACRSTTRPHKKGQKKF